MNKPRKFIKGYFTSSGDVKRQSADIRRQNESVDTDNPKITSAKTCANSVISAIEESSHETAYNVFDSEDTDSSMIDFVDASSTLTPTPRQPLPATTPITDVANIDSCDGGSISKVG